ncbi:nucleolar protein 58 isoform X1 [Cinnamomum micranthum f. kanehirae]|uniref:Nucleolar protein 58 isoform X1 n=1 Tax=Cinnamomum micranthum f. kanehirae TaxID=337451 RepID=A0A443NDI8_9MAGN|nr:nucleolar protein 58 isoform X1 [Cinnamomum micranthum f. kanehirae]
MKERALRGSRFASLPPPPPSSSRFHPRLAHPGGPLATNKAAALAKFLERKLQEPGGLSSINPDLVELAVKNAKETLKASTSGSSNLGRTVRHVNSFGDSSKDSGEDEENQSKAKETKLKKCKKKKNKRKKLKLQDSGEDEENRSKDKEIKLKKSKKKNNKMNKLSGSHSFALQTIPSGETIKPSKHKKKFKS